MIEHKDTWIVLVSASTHWHNYRHLTNAMSLYTVVKSLGIQDDHIIFMNALGSICNNRNIYPGKVLSQKPDNRLNVVNHDKYSNICPENVEFDYIDQDVTVESFLQLFHGKYDNSVDISKRLMSSDSSNVMIFLSGHGGNGFFKFRDIDELSSHSLASSIESMYRNRRYRKLLLVIDTCQASTMGEFIHSPNVTIIASSQQGENSYAHNAHEELGVALIDRFSYAFSNQLLSRFQNSSVIDKRNREKNSLSNIVKSLDSRFLYSTPSIKSIDSFDNDQWYEYFMNPSSRDINDFINVSLASSRKSTIIQGRNNICSVHDTCRRISNDCNNLSENKILLTVSEIRGGDPDTVILQTLVYAFIFVLLTILII